MKDRREENGVIEIPFLGIIKGKDWVPEPLLVPNGSRRKQSFEIAFQETSGFGHSGSLFDSLARKTASSIVKVTKELSSVELLYDTDTFMWECKDADSIQDSPFLVIVLQQWFTANHATREELRDGPNGSESEVTIVTAREFRHFDMEELWMQDEATYYFCNDLESVVPIEAARAHRCFDSETLWIQDEATYYFCKVLQNHPGYLTAFDV